MELGGGLGGAFYIGDANSKPFANLGPMGSIVARYIFNPRMAIKGNLAVGHISGDTGADFFPQDAGSGDAVSSRHSILRKRMRFFFMVVSIICKISDEGRIGRLILLFQHFCQLFL